MNKTAIKIGKWVNITIKPPYYIVNQTPNVAILMSLFKMLTFNHCEILQCTTHFCSLRKISPAKSPKEKKIYDQTRIKIMVMKKHKGYSTKSNSFDIDKIEKGIKENKKRKENKNVQHEAKVRTLFNRIGH